MPTTKPDVHVTNCRLYFLPVVNRVPLRFGRETVTSATCARAAVEVEDGQGRRFWGWGETPLNTAWVWPGELTHGERDDAMREFSGVVGLAFARFAEKGHALEVGHLFLSRELPSLWEAFNTEKKESRALPWLAALACLSAFDLALHDAYGAAVGKPVYDTYTPEFMNHDLSWYYDSECAGRFVGRYPGDFLQPMATALTAWHLVGGGDPLDASELCGDEPEDGFPVLLGDWIRRDGLTCLKVKLEGDDARMDLERLRRVGELGVADGVKWLCADFNCTVEQPAYVVEILDRLAAEHPRILNMLLYLEQPFHRDLHTHMHRVDEIASRKPLFMDESAHDWKHVRLGRSLGWNGVALKTCKTQTGSLLSLCWAKAAGMRLMVQDLANPMLAQIPHVLLAAHAGTLMGVETNAMQFYPDASSFEAEVHPGLYARREGRIDLRTIAGPGFGYRLEEMRRILPPPDFSTDS